MSSPRPLSSTELRDLIAYTTSPPHPLSAAAILPTWDPEQARLAQVRRILAMVAPPSRWPPIRLTRDGFRRLRAMFAPPSTYRPWGAWQSDINQIERREVPGGSPIPEEWHGLTFALGWTPVCWHGQFVPFEDGSRRYYIRWRRILPFPSSAGQAPVTLADLEALVEAQHTARAADPLPRRSWRDFLQPWARAREGLSP